MDKKIIAILLVLILISPVYARSSGRGTGETTGKRPIFSFLPLFSVVNDNLGTFELGERIESGKQYVTTSEDISPNDDLIVEVQYEYGNHEVLSRHNCGFSANDGEEIWLSFWAELGTPGTHKIVECIDNNPSFPINPNNCKAAYVATVTIRGSEKLGTCYDSEVNIDRYKKGYVRIEGQTQEESNGYLGTTYDHCLSSNELGMLLNPDRNAPTDYVGDFQCRQYEDAQGYFHWTADYDEYKCPLGCMDGRCIEHHHKNCYNGDVYWFNHYNIIEDQYEDCNFGCQNSECIIPSPSTTPQPVGFTAFLSQIWNWLATFLR